MRKLLKKIRRWYYKFPVYSCLMKDAAYGKFKVIYPDGKKSINMCWKNAKSYRDIFGGEVVDDF